MNVLQGDSGIVARGYGTACLIESVVTDEPNEEQAPRERLESKSDISVADSMTGTTEFPLHDSSPTHRFSVRRRQRKCGGSFELRLHEVRLACDIISLCTYSDKGSPVALYQITVFV